MAEIARVLVYLPCGAKYAQLWRMTSIQIQAHIAAMSETDRAAFVARVEQIQASGITTADAIQQAFTERTGAWFTIAVWNASGELIDIAMLQDAREAYQWYSMRARLMRATNLPDIMDSWNRLASQFARVALIRATSETEWQGKTILEVSR